MCKINVISVDNGVGLTKDYQILKDLIHGAEFNFIDIYKGGQLKAADINIYLEVIDERSRFYKLAPVNILIPNPEWFAKNWLNHLRLMDAVWCKTYHGVGVFNKLHSNVSYIGFTSVDRYDKAVEKRFICGHFAGKSSLKNTETVYDSFKKITSVKLLLTHQNRKYQSLKSHDNTRVCYSQFTESQYNVYYNNAMIHVCPSQMEGFGHYINEARSTGAIVITLDAAPMNEFKGCCYLPAKTAGYQNYGELYTFNQNDLVNLINEISNKSDDELINIGDKAREYYLNDRKEFIFTINKIINDTLLR